MSTSELSPQTNMENEFGADVQSTPAGYRTEIGLLRSLAEVVSKKMLKPILIGATVLSTFGVISADAPNVASARIVGKSSRGKPEHINRKNANLVHPARPDSFIAPTLNFYQSLLGQSAGLVGDMQHLYLSDYHLHQSGKCQYNKGGVPLDQEEIVDGSLKGEYNKYCTKVNGKLQTGFIPFNKLNPVTQQPSMDLTPILDANANRAFNSVNIPGADCASVNHMVINIDPHHHQSEASFVCNPGQQPGGLESLELHTFNGRETWHTVWFTHSSFVHHRG